MTLEDLNCPKCCKRFGEDVKMILKRISRSVERIIEHPKVLLGKFKGIPTCHLFTCLTARDLLNEPIKTVIDIGANEGSFIRAVSFCFQDSKIYAFEPIKRFYDKIKYIENVCAFNFGLWDEDGEDVFYENKKEVGASSFLEPTKQYYKDISSKNNIVKTRATKKRFDKLNLPIKRPCFVKIDVEGAEHKVLRGFGNRLKEVDVLQIEWFFKGFNKNQMKLSDIIFLLEKYGFVGFIQREVGYVNNSLGACDLIFFKQEERK